MVCRLDDGFNEKKRKEIKQMIEARLTNRKEALLGNEIPPIPNVKRTKQELSTSPVYKRTKSMIPKRLDKIVAAKQGGESPQNRSYYANIENEKAETTISQLTKQLMETRKILDEFQKSSKAPVKKTVRRRIDVGPDKETKYKIECFLNYSDTNESISDDEEFLKFDRGKYEVTSSYDHEHDIDSTEAICNEGEVSAKDIAAHEESDPFTDSDYTELGKTLHEEIHDAGGYASEGRGSDKFSNCSENITHLEACNMLNESEKMLSTILSSLGDSFTENERLTQVQEQHQRFQENDVLVSDTSSFEDLRFQNFELPLLKRSTESEHESPVSDIMLPSRDLTVQRPSLHMLNQNKIAEAPTSSSSSKQRPSKENIDLDDYEKGLSEIENLLTKYDEYRLSSAENKAERLPARAKHPINAKLSHQKMLKDCKPTKPIPIPEQEGGHYTPHQDVSNRPHIPVLEKRTVESNIVIKQENEEQQWTLPRPYKVSDPADFASNDKTLSKLPHYSRISKGADTPKRHVPLSEKDQVSDTLGIKPKSPTVETSVGTKTVGKSSFKIPKKAGNLAKKNTSKLPPKNDALLSRRQLNRKGLSSKENSSIPTRRNATHSQRETSARKLLSTNIGTKNDYSCPSGADQSKEEIKTNSKAHQIKKHVTTPNNASNNKSEPLISKTATTTKANVGSKKSPEKEYPGKRSVSSSPGSKIAKRSPTRTIQSAANTTPSLPTGSMQSAANTTPRPTRRTQHPRPPLTVAPKSSDPSSLQQTNPRPPSTLSTKLYNPSSPQQTNPRPPSTLSTKLSNPSSPQQTNPRPPSNLSPKSSNPSSPQQTNPRPPSNLSTKLSNPSSPQQTNPRPPSNLSSKSSNPSSPQQTNPRPPSTLSTKLSNPSSPQQTNPRHHSTISPNSSNPSSPQLTDPRPHSTVSCKSFNPPSKTSKEKSKRVSSSPSKSSADHRQTESHKYISSSANTRKNPSLARSEDMPVMKPIRLYKNSDRKKITVNTQNRTVKFDNRGTYLDDEPTKLRGTNSFSKSVKLEDGDSSITGILKKSLPTTKKAVDHDQYRKSKVPVSTSSYSSTRSSSNQNRSTVRGHATKYS